MDAIEISVTADAAGLERLSARLGALAGEALRAALAGGLAEAGEYAAGEIVMQAQAAGIQSRTGALLSSIGTWSQRGAEALEVFVGVPDESPAARYAYLLTEQDVTIVPNGHKFLAIPIGENLTGAGVAKLSSPRDLGNELVFRGRTAGILSGEDYTPLFALVESVTIFGRDVFDPALEAAYPEMVATVQEQVDRLLAEEGG